MKFCTLIPPLNPEPRFLVIMHLPAGFIFSTRSFWEMFKAIIEIDSQNQAGGTGNKSTQAHDDKLVYDGMEE
jgi:hypothetical protein